MQKSDRSYLTSFSRKIDSKTYFSFAQSNQRGYFRRPRIELLDKKFKLKNGSIKFDEVEFGKSEPLPNRLVETAKDSTNLQISITVPDGELRKSDWKPLHPIKSELMIAVMIGLHAKSMQQVPMTS